MQSTSPQKRFVNQEIDTVDIWFNIKSGIIDTRVKLF